AAPVSGRITARQIAGEIDARCQHAAEAVIGQRLPGLLRVELSRLRHQQLDEIATRFLGAREGGEMLAPERTRIEHRDNADLIHAFTAPAVNPPTRRLCTRRNRMVTGSATS